VAHHYCQPSVFPFLGANGAVEAGHQAEIHLLRDAVVLMKDAVANGVVPVGWPDAISADPLMDLETYQASFSVEFDQALNAHIARVIEDAVSSLEVSERC
jgi:hypothetical protein